MLWHLTTRKNNKMAKKNDTASGSIGAVGFLIRLVFALILVLLTFNPSGESAYHWILETFGETRFGPLHLLLIALLLVGWSIYWIATWRALGTLGVVLAGLVLGALIWGLFDIGWLEDKSAATIQWIVLVSLSFVLAIGVSWSHFWRRITGQINVEDVDD